MNPHCHFAIAERPQECLDAALALDFVSDPAFGGIALFVGRIRDHNLGRVVTGISYDLFDALCLTRFAEFAARAQAEVGPRLKLYVAHAKGRLGIGDIAVLVAAGTPHRDEAFRACRLLIEAVKHEAPIWKQEHYVDGSSAWSEGCSLCEEQRTHEAKAADCDHEHHHHEGAA